MPGTMMPEIVMTISWYTIDWMMTEAAMTISGSTAMIDVIIQVGVEMSTSTQTLNNKIPV